MAPAIEKTTSLNAITMVEIAADRRASRIVCLKQTRSNLASLNVELSTVMLAFKLRQVAPNVLTMVLA